MAGERRERAGAERPCCHWRTRRHVKNARRPSAWRPEWGDERARADDRPAGTRARGARRGGRRPGNELAAARPGLVEGEVDERPVSGPACGRWATPLAGLRAELAAVLAQRPRPPRRGAHLRAFLGELAGLEDAEQSCASISGCSRRWWRPSRPPSTATIRTPWRRSTSGWRRWRPRGRWHMTDARDTGPSALLDVRRDGRSQPPGRCRCRSTRSCWRRCRASTPVAQTRWTVDECRPAPVPLRGARWPHHALLRERAGGDRGGRGSVGGGARPEGRDGRCLPDPDGAHRRVRPNPRRDIARIRLDEIADYRAVRRRRGTLHRLYEDFTREVLRLAELRLTMVWQDYPGRGTVGLRQAAAGSPARHRRHRTRPVTARPGPPLVAAVARRWPIS